MWECLSGTQHAGLTEGAAEEMVSSGQTSWKTSRLPNASIHATIRNQIDLMTAYEKISSMKGDLDDQFR